MGAYAGLMLKETARWDGSHAAHTSCRVESPCSYARNERSEGIEKKAVCYRIIRY